MKLITNIMNAPNSAAEILSAISRQIGYILTRRFRAAACCLPGSNFPKVLRQLGCPVPSSARAGVFKLPRDESHSPHLPTAPGRTPSESLRFCSLRDQRGILLLLVLRNP